MEYVGIYTQQRRNNIRSILLLVSFPLLMLLLLYIGCYIVDNSAGIFIAKPYPHSVRVEPSPERVNEQFLALAPYVLGMVLIWFLIAFYINVKIIDTATGARPLQRKTNMKVYNMVENLCISSGMNMPQVHIIEDSALNAFASGVSEKSYTITLTRGLINTLKDDELEGVIAHELMHIKNHDVRVLVISIVFVGIFSLIAQVAVRGLFLTGGGGRGGNRRSGGGAALIIVLVIILAAVGYFMSLILRFAISRKREYMADAGAADLTRNPLALANALKRISGYSCLKSKHDECVAQLFIEHDPDNRSFFSSIFATHPPIEERIRILEQF